jgi:tetratricopeptide (TPR) repeat protein
MIYEANFEQALETITNFEKNIDLDPQDQLSSLLLRGRISIIKGEYLNAVQIGDEAYQLSIKLGNASESINALLLKAAMLFLGKYKEALGVVTEAEKKHNELNEKSSLRYSHQKTSIYYYKAWVYALIGLFDKAFKMATKCLELREKIGKKLDIANSLLILGRVCLYIGDRNAGLDYAMRSLALSEELNDQVGIATSLSLVGIAYNYKGNFFQAIDYCNQSLSIREIRDTTKAETLYFLGVIYGFQGEIDKAIKYHQEAAEITKKLGNDSTLSLNLVSLGINYRMKGKTKDAVDYLKRSLELSEETGGAFVIGMSSLFLILIYLDENSRDLAKHCLDRLKKFIARTEGKQFTHFYLLAKGHFLKQSGKSRDRVEAEKIFKQIVDNKISNPILYIMALGALCDYLIEELYMSNDKEILDELNPLIIRFLNITEKTHSYSMLTMTKWLQAKVALIQIKITEAKRLFSEAQRLAELHNLFDTAQKISNEHDNLLEQVNAWNTLKNKNAPMAERINLASVNVVLDRLQNRRVLDPPELTDEEPVLLLIMAEGGVLIFSYPFAEEWKFDDDLFSGFLNSFSSISDEIFSEGLDRAKFGQYTVLMNSVGTFSVCYLFKGPSYLALQKLTIFAERIQDEPIIWQTLEKFYKTSQILELKDIPSIESIITETLLSKTPELIKSNYHL